MNAEPHQLDAAKVLEQILEALHPEFVFTVTVVGRAIAPVDTKPSPPTKVAREPKTFVTVKEVAGRVRLRPETVRQAILEGELSAYKFGQEYRMDPADVGTWIDAHSQGGL